MLRTVLSIRTAALYAVAALFVAGCGSQASGPAPAAGPGGSTGVASLEVTTSKTTMSARTGESADITVTALDSNRVAVANVPVTLQANSGIVTATGTSTDDTGKVTARFELGQDRSNRTVTISANSGSVAGSVAIDVTGTTLSLSANPSSVSGPTVTSRLTARLLDANSQPIGGATVTFGTTQGTLTANTATTDPSGVAIADISGVSTSATVTAQSGNTTASASITSSGAAGAGLLPAGIVLGDFTVQANPSVIGTNQAGNTGNFSLIEARVTGTVGTTNNVTAQNAPVRFRISSTPALGTLEVDTTTTASLTNASGLASNRFIAGATPSGTDAVVVCVSVDGLTPATPGLNTGTTCNAQEKAVKLTIAQQALFVRISTNNEIQKVDNNLNYEKLFSVSVTDAAGRGVPGVQVTPRLLPEWYFKGAYVLPPSTGDWTRPTPVSCRNEDKNFNGVLDLGDVNENTDAFVWPGQAAAISIDNNGRTDGTGFVILRVKYGQRFATWAQYQVEARASVGGTEGLATMSYGLSAATDDIKNRNATPGFQTSPFGTAAVCSDPN